MTNSDPNNLLALLLHESAQARDDDRYMSSQLAVVIGSAITLILGMAVFFYTTCPVGAAPNTEYCPHTTFIAIPIWLYVSALMPPIGLLGYAVTISTTMALRSYYMRVLERRIHELTNQLDTELPIPSWAHLQLEITGQAHAGLLARLNWYVIYIITMLTVLGACLYIAFFKIPDVRYRIFALIVDMLLIGIPLAAAALDTVSGAHLWHQARTALQTRLNRTREHFPFEQRTERSLTSFLILPRNQKTCPKLSTY
jgi:hypothetical protein